MSYRIALTLCTSVVMAACTPHASSDGGTVDLAGFDAGPDLTSDGPFDPCGVMMPATAVGQLVSRCAVGSPPAIDGDLHDWAFPSLHVARSAMSAGLGWGGTWPDNVIAQDHTLSADFWSAWDLDYVYFAAVIQDDVVKGAPTANQPWNADAIELFFDADNNRSANYDADDRRLILPFDVASDPAGNLCGAAPCAMNWPVKAETKPTANGWQIEVRIPWSAVGGSARAGRTIGFEIQMDDNDLGPARDRFLMWFLDPAVLMGGMPPFDSAIHPPLFGRLYLGPR